jgi:enoyl-CoA hydratase/carnithine racemase
MHGVGTKTRRDLHAVQVFDMGEDTTMTVRELRAALSSLEANSDVQVVLFKNDGTSEVFELEEVLSNDGHAQLEIYEDEPVREENPEG